VSDSDSLIGNVYVATPAAVVAVVVDVVVVVMAVDVVVAFDVPVVDVSEDVG
jgi:hypothetical protein